MDNPSEVSAALEGCKEGGGLVLVPDGDHKGAVRLVDGEEEKEYYVSQSSMVIKGSVSNSSRNNMQKKAVAHWYRSRAQRPFDVTPRSDVAICTAAHMGCVSVSLSLIMLASSPSAKKFVPTLGGDAARPSLPCDRQMRARTDSVILFIQLCLLVFLVLSRYGVVSLPFPPRLPRLP